ncbi:hypothetical protein [Pontibacter pamirensis]|uniref:hypothetical protein n=1 Tax=Pontibacter pamirensis TaxID=2562824 RepID=UPI00138A5FA0|nr:hypothetical protein [Pontibacter pamirensis]
MKENVVLFVFMIGCLLYSCTEQEEVTPMSSSVGQVVLKAETEATALTGEALDAVMSLPCRKALEGKCFRGDDVALDPTVIRNEFEADMWCNQAAVDCAPTECAERVKVLLGLKPASSTGNPCLPGAV